MRLIGTAGHVDHGKSALVEALTGIHPSHLPEEHARGMTIDLGYAYLDHPDGFRLGIVDVPGHEKLIKNMVAGATGFELALWVVDACESVMPQSREHLQILDLLGVRSLIPVVTKAELASKERIAATRGEMAELLRRISVPVESLQVVDSLSRRGIAELKRAILTLCRSRDSPRGEGLTYLPIDRVFSVKGAGTVVTGTLLRGRLAEGARVALSSLPGTWRVRSLNNHHTRVEEIGEGHRVGVNLAGLGADAVRRGDTLTAPEYPYVGRFLNARLHWVEEASREWKPGVRALFHAGAAETQCRLWDLVREGEVAWGQVELPSEMRFFPGQRFILRSTNPLVTIGGGEVLDLAPDRPRRFTPAERSAYRLRERGEAWLGTYLAGSGERVFELPALARRWLVPDAELRRQAAASPELCIGHGEAGPFLVWRRDTGTELLERLREFVASLPRGERSLPYRALERELGLRSPHPGPWLRCLFAEEHPAAAFLREHTRLEGAGLVLYPGVVPWSAAERDLAHRILTRLQSDGLRPSRVSEYREVLADPDGLLDPVLAKLQGEGRVVRIDEKFVLHADVAAELHRAVAEGDVDGARASEWGRALGVSRKYGIPFLEYLNREGILRRDGDLHYRTGRGAG